MPSIQGHNINRPHFPDSRNLACNSAHGQVHPNLWNLGIGWLGPDQALPETVNHCWFGCAHVAHVVVGFGV